MANEQFKTKSETFVSNDNYEPSQIFNAER